MRQEHDMTNVSWPNEASPGLAPFRLDVPDSWTAAENAGALLVLLGPEQDGFRPNICVFGQRLDAAVGVAEVAEAATESSGFVVERRDEPAEDGTLPAAVRRTAEVADGMEIHHVTVSTEADDVSPAGLRSVFTLVGSYQAAHMPEDQPVIERAIASFTVRSPGVSPS
jgi:hypothetical protein